MDKNSISCEDFGKYVFHYTSLKNCVEILDTHHIRLSPLERTNDPYEWTNWPLDWVDRYLPKDTKAIEERHLSIQQTWSQIRKRFQVFGGYCESKANEGPKQDGRTQIPMWAHYGDNHEGVCLVIDRKRFTENLRVLFPSSFSKSVRYGGISGADYLKAHDLPESLLNVQDHKTLVRKHAREHIDQLFYTKSRAWQGESEWRWVVDHWREDYIHVPIDHSLIEVVLGQKVRDFYYPAMREAVRANRAHLFRATWDPLLGGIECNPL